MSTRSLADLMSKAGSKENVDISSTTLEDVPELEPDSPSTSPPAPSALKRPPLTKSAGSKGPYLSSRNPGDMSLQKTPRMRSFLSEVEGPDESGQVSQLDTPVREQKAVFGDAVNGVGAGSMRGRSSLGPPKTQMTLREQEKVIDTIRKENFSLKLQVHLLEERLGQLAPAHVEETFKNNIKLKIEVHSRGTEIKRLTKLVKQLHGELAAMDERANQTANDGAVVDRLEGEIQLRDDEIKQLKKQLREAKSGPLASSSTSTRKLQDDNAVLAERNAELEEEQERRAAMLEETTDELENLRRVIEEDEYRQRTEELEAVNKELEDRLEEYQLALRDRDDEADLMQEEMRGLEARLEEAHHQVHHSRSESRAQIYDELEDKERLQKQLDDHRDKWAAINIELETKEDELDELRQIAADQEAELDEQKRVNGELHAELEDLDGTLRDHEDELQRIRQERDDLNADLLSTNAELQGHADRIYELEGTLETVEKQLETERRVVKELEGDYEQMVEKERSLLDKIIKKDEELNDTRDRYEDIRIRLVNFSERSKELEDQIDRLSDDVEAERRLRKSVEDAYAQLEDRMKETQALLRQAEDRVEKEVQDGERRRRRDVAETKQVAEEAEQSLRMTLSQRERDVSELQDKLNEVEHSIRDIGEEHTSDRFSLELELERVRRELSNTKESLEKLQAESDAHADRFKENREELDRMHAENRNLQKQLAEQTQARLNISTKLDFVQGNARSTVSDLTDVRRRYAELEAKLHKDQIKLQNEVAEQRDKLTERNTLLLTIHQYLEKILGISSPKKGSAISRGVTNFAVFHEELMSRLRSISQISTDFEKRCKLIEATFVAKFKELDRKAEGRWRQVDKFEDGLKKFAEKNQSWRKKYQEREGELESLRASKTALEAQIVALRRANPSIGELNTSELKGLATRVKNAESRANHAQNLLLKKDDAIANSAGKLRTMEEKLDKYISRIKELERIHDQDVERLKTEKQGSKDAVAVIQKDNVALRDTMLRLNDYQERLVQELVTRKIPVPSSDRRTSR